MKDNTNKFNYFCLPLIKYKTDKLFRFYYKNYSSIIPTIELFENEDVNKTEQIIGYNKLLLKIFELNNIEITDNIEITSNLLLEKIKIVYPIEFYPSVFDIYVSDSEKINNENLNSIKLILPFKKFQNLYFSLKKYSETELLTLQLFKQKIRIPGTEDFQSFLYDSYFLNTAFLIQQLFSKHKIFKYEIFDSMKKLFCLLFIDETLTLEEIFELHPEKYEEHINNNFMNMNKIVFYHTVELTILDLIGICDQLNKKIPHIVDLNIKLKKQFNNSFKNNVLSKFPTLFFGQGEYNFNIYLNNEKTDIIDISQLEEIKIINTLNNWIYSKESKINVDSQITNIFEFEKLEETTKTLTYELKDMIKTNKELQQYDLLEYSDLKSIITVFTEKNYIKDMESLIEETLNETEI